MGRRKQSRSGNVPPPQEVMDVREEATISPFQRKLEKRWRLLKTLAGFILLLRQKINLTMNKPSFCCFNRIL